LNQNQKRIRRTPEDARALILEAAEGTIARTGPAGLRLQDVAKAAGVSHPTILHHFGSREGLVKALNLRTLEELKAVLVAGMKADTSNGEDGIARTFAAYRGGLGERMVWLMQSEAAPPPGSMTIFEGIVAALHEVRTSFARPGHPPDIADTRAVVHLTTIAALGDALMGARLRQTTGAEERAQGAAFEKWFSALITQFLRSKV
jgi:AcrR family transcriptional regulator